MASYNVAIVADGVMALLRRDGLRSWPRVSVVIYSTTVGYSYTISERSISSGTQCTIEGFLERFP